MNRRITVLLVVLCIVVGCAQQTPVFQPPTSSKPEYAAPSHVPQQKLISLAIAKVEAAGLGPKYNVIRPLYVQTPSQMGEDFVGFSLGQPKPDAEGFVRLRCVVPVNSLRGTAGQPEELLAESRKVFVRIDENGKVAGFKTEEPQQTLPADAAKPRR
jgi:hypothetical protein